MRSRLALYWKHVVTFTLITNISPTSLELQSALLRRSPNQLAWSLAELLTLSMWLCLFGFMSRHSCQKAHLLHVFIPEHSVHFKDWLLTLPQEKVIIGVAYDCVEKMVYWTEITSPSISKANIQGGEPVAVIRSGSVTVYCYASLYWFCFIFRHLWNCRLFT